MGAENLRLMGIRCPNPKLVPSHYTDNALSVHIYTRMWSDIKKRDCACKPFYLTNSGNQLQSPSKQFPSELTHSCIRCCQSSKQFRRSCSVRLLRVSAVFAFTFSTDTKWVPLSTDLIFGKKQKSQRARSGE